jgi:hypothetical protein
MLWFYFCLSLHLISSEITPFTEFETLIDLQNDYENR